MSRNNKEWTDWNVRLWLNNDEGLYRLARERVREQDRRKLHFAAICILEDLHGRGLTKTPDGAQYTVANIKRAIEDM